MFAAKKGTLAVLSMLGALIAGSVNPAWSQGFGGPQPPPGGPHELQNASPNFSSTILPTDATRVNRPWQVLQVPPAVVGVNPGVCRFSLSTCQIVQDSKNRFAFRALAGSLYSIEADRRIKLVRGRLMARANSESLDIETGIASVAAEPGTGVIVETAQNGLTRIYCLSGSGTGPSAFVKTAEGATKVPLFPGQEMVASAHDLSSDELIAVDGIERHDISGSITSLSRKIRVSEISFAQLVQYDSLIGCITTGKSRSLDSVVDQVNRRAHEQKGFGKTLASKQGAAPDNTNAPGQNRTTYETLKDDEEILALATTGATVNVDSASLIRLEKGGLLVTSKQPLKVQATGREVIIAKGAVALVYADHATLRVTNISDVAKDTVQVIYGNNNLSLMPGKQILFTADPPHLSDVFDSGKIGHRAISARESGDFWITASEVSLLDAVVHEPLIAALRKTGTSTVERQLITRLTKEAAIISVVHRGSEYERVEGTDQAVADGTTGPRCNACLD